MKKMIVVGGGAAGMMCALKAAGRYEVTLIEKNEKLGKKLFITGKGRCNLTNNCDEEEFLKNVVNNYKFLYSSIYSYNQSMVMDDFESWGLRLKTERGNRVFPTSDHSSDVIKVLEEQLKKRRVKILLNTNVEKLSIERIINSDNSDAVDEITDDVKADRKKENKKDAAELSVSGVYAGGKFIPADVVVLATGGLSYPQTGSTGDGFRFLKDSGIKVTEIYPALCPLVIKESFCHDMMGLSLRNVSVTVEYIPDEPTKKNKQKKLYSEQGEMLFTHFGISGPLILSASSYIASFVRKTETDGKKSEEVKTQVVLSEENPTSASASERLSKERVNNVNAFFKEIKGKITVSIDLKPALDFEELDRRVIRDFEMYSGRDFSNSLGQLLPRAMIPVIVRLSAVKPDKKVNSITQEERHRLVNLLKHLELNVAGFKGFNEAIISSGGVDTKCIDSSDMSIKGISGLRVCGEMIDVDAMTGGFNLQIAWSTANLASV